MEQIVTNKDMLQQQLLALQANCVSIVQIVESTLSLLNGIEKSPSVTEPEMCLHPKDTLQDARTMGNPTRWRCPQCDEFLEIANDQIPQGRKQEIN
jgi:hypothetical protein|tara:strand:- start:557 stop:844 length:288 start_codon:yes stop_codon:yes gene_type:complete